MICDLDVWRAGASPDTILVKVIVHGQ